MDTVVCRFNYGVGIEIEWVVRSLPSNVLLEYKLESKFDRIITKFTNNNNNGLQTSEPDNNKNPS